MVDPNSPTRRNTYRAIMFWSVRQEFVVEYETDGIKGRLGHCCPRIAIMSCVWRFWVSCMYSHLFTFPLEPEPFPFAYCMFDIMIERKRGGGGRRRAAICQK